MNKNEVLTQLESLREYCEKMKSKERNIWTNDVEALRIAINAIKKEGVTY